MSLFPCTLLLSILVGIDAETQRCDDIPEADIPEIDVLSFIEGSMDKKLEIANRFDDAFHRIGAVRLINHGIPYELMIELLNKTAEFFDESLDFKMKLVNKINTSNLSDWHGFVPFGDETVGSYKGDKTKKVSLVESLHIASNWANRLEMQKGNAFRPKHQLPPYLGDIMPTYWQKTRQLIYNLHSIASMALGFDENIFEQYMTSNSFLDFRLANYLELDLETMPEFRFDPHRDFSGFTFITNDHVAGLQVSVNSTWYKITPKVGSIIVLGGEFIERWTNSYWISSLHAVKSLPDRRICAIAFASPDFDMLIDILPCTKCMESERKFEPVTCKGHLAQRVKATIKEY